MTNGQQMEPGAGEPEPVPSERAVSSETCLGADSRVIDANDKTPKGDVVPPATVATPEAEKQAASASLERRLFFLTNRMNLNGVLSSRIVAPRESFHKYYADLLVRCPGWVPLLTTPPPQSLIDDVTSERGSGSPAIVEFPVSVLETERSDEPVVYVRALAVSHAVAIHFKDKRALREHRARGYSNVHPHDQLLQVTPELFESSGATDVVIESPRHDEHDHTVDWQAIDRLRGATNGVLAASNDGETLAVAAAALGTVELPDQVIVPAWLHGVLLHDVAVPADALDVHDRAERVLFEAASRVLGDRDTAEAWSPSEVLDAVSAAVVDSKSHQAVASSIEPNLSRVRELINVEREFEPFRSTSNALNSAKALLLALLRIDLTELLAWPREETGADDVTRAVAAMYAGRLRGLARESVELRSVVLDDLTAEWAVRRARGSDEPSGVVTFSAEESGTSISINGISVAKSLPLIPDPVLMYDSLDLALKPDARVAVARALGWPVVVQIRLPSDAEVVQDERSIRVTSSEFVEIDSSVGEEGFATRLRATAGPVRRRASDALFPLMATSGRADVESGDGRA